MNGKDINEFWHEILRAVEKDIPAPTFHSWVEPLVPVSYDDTQFLVKTGHLLASNCLMNYQTAFHSAIKQVLGSELRFHIIYDEELSKTLKKKVQSKKEQLNETNLIDVKENKFVKYEQLKQMQSACNLNTKYKFENFVVGAGAKFAYAASHTVAEFPGKKYNPLFIYGGSGLGKTHLMQSIGNYNLSNSNLKVKYVTSEDFLNELVASLVKGGDKGSQMSKFRQQYRNVDILLIDDIQFIAGKERMTEELFNTFETLYLKGKQIVLTSDRPPKEIDKLPDRLRSRFEMGLMADIQPPDLETRMAILMKLAEVDKITMPLDVVEFIASVFSRNVRELEGAYNKVTAHASLYERELTVDYVKEIIHYTENKQIITSTFIIEQVAKYFSISEDDIISAARSQKYSKARQIAMYLAKKHAMESLTEMSETFKKKHSTVLFAYKKISEDIVVNNKLAKDIELIEKTIK